MAGRRVHIVVLSAEELDEQDEFSRDTISFAVDRSDSSPGYGRAAVIASHDDRGKLVFTHLGWVKSGRRRTNLDSTWVLSSLHKLERSIPFNAVESELGRWAIQVRTVASTRRGGALSDAASSVFRQVLEAKIGGGNWPAQDGIPEWMLPRVEGQIALDHTNAVGTALTFSDMDLGALRSAPLPGISPLADLRVHPTEASLIDNDLRNFPGMDGDQQAEDIVRFTDGEHVLDVMNVNATGIESATGVDLIYHSHDYDCFVLVQYKRMESESGQRIASVDARLPDQLSRMVAFDSFGQTNASVTEPAAFRIGPSATFTKFAYPVVTPQKESDLTRGMYVPSAFLKRLHDKGELTGPRGGAAVTHDNLNRWFGNTHFAELVKKGWVGTSGVTSADIKAYVDRTLADGRIAVIAAHKSELMP